MTTQEERPLSVRQSARMLFELLESGAKWRLVGAAVFSGVLALFETVAILTVLPLVQLATGAPVDQGAIGRVWELLGSPSRGVFGLMLVGLVVGLFIVKDLGTVAFSWWQLGYIARQRVATSTRIFRSVMALDYDEFRARSVSQYLTIINSAVANVFGAVVGGLMSAIAAGLSVAAVVAALLIATPVQAIVALAYFGLGALAYSLFVRPRLTRAGELILDGSIELTLAGMQGLHGFKEIKLRHSSEYFIERFARGMAASERGQRLGGFFSSVTKYLLEILFILGVGGLLAYSFATLSAAQAVGSLALFVAAGFRLLPNIASLVSSVNGMRTGHTSLQVLHDEVTEMQGGHRRTRPDTAEPVTLQDRLELTDVTFRYPGSDRDVLKGIDLTIPFGSSIAFVGGSGAGKTTLVDLLLGLHSPTGGVLAVDGHDIAPRMHAWQEQCAMVAQDVFLTEDSVRQNILFDQPPETADEGRLARAIAGAQLDDVVRSLPEGLDSSAGDWGNRLSGGQRQRVGIARALYREPRLLVLDEATSALDNETESRIIDTIEALHGSVTVVVVAHRLSTVKEVDAIIFLQQGRVAAQGTFAELQETNTDFARLVKLGKL